MSFTANELKDFLESIRFVYGYDFTGYAEASVKRRVTYFMSKFRIGSIGDLAKSLLKDESFFEAFIQEVTVTALASMKHYTTNYIKAGGESSFSNYYKAKYDSVLFDKTLRQNIVFAPHNLSIDKSFNEFQLIICRNVLIYFNQQLQNQVIGLFYESLCPFGFLGIGNKESLLFSDKKRCFEDVEKKQKIYKKIR